MKPKIAIVQDTRKPLKGGLFPVKLRVTFRVSAGGVTKWVQKYFGEGLYLSEKEFKTLAAPRSVAVQAVKMEADRMYQKARSIIDVNKGLSPKSFEMLFVGEAFDTVNGMFDKVINEMNGAGRIGTAQVNRNALNSFYRYNKGEVIRFSDVTEEWLKGYESEMVKGGRSLNYIGINMRTLRAVFNRAIRLKVIPSDNYPFLNYKIRSESKFKIPLSDSDLKAIKAFRPVNELQCEALEYWKLSYYMNGIQYGDLARLRHEDVNEDFILYDRSKTRRTLINFKKIVIPIDHEIASLIKRRSRSLSGYLFPVLEEGLSELTIKNRVHRFIKCQNRQLKEIGLLCGIKKKLTTVIARHTFGNRMMNGGVDRRLISDALGHTSEKTTEHYLGSINIERVKESRRFL